MRYQHDQAAAEFAAKWFRRPEHARDEGTLACLLATMLHETYRIGAEMEQYRVMRKIRQVLEIGDGG